MIRRSGVVLRSLRLNHALRTPAAKLETLHFVTKPRDPFDSDKFSLLIPRRGDRRVQLIARPALHGIYCTVGLILPTGSRHTAHLPSGICHLDEKLAYGPTDSFSSRDEISRFLDKCGAICDSQTDQETTIFALSIKRTHLAEGVKLLIETAFQPAITAEDIAEAFSNVEQEVKYLSFEKIRDKEILELTVEAGFKGQQVGVARSMEDSLFEGFNPEDWREAIFQHRSENYLRKDPIFVGVGMSVEELGKPVNKNMKLISNPSWDPLPPIPEVNLDETDVEPVEEPVFKSAPFVPAHWTGGFAHRRSESQSFSIGDTEETSYFSVGWRAPGFYASRDAVFKDRKIMNMTVEQPFHAVDRYICHVLRALLGGGSAFESGGPGKGIKSFLYRDVLASKQGQKFSHFKAHYKEFTDCGIFTIYGIGPPDQIRMGVNIAQRVMRSISKGNLTAAEVERAKIQLINQFLRDMEIRAELMESYGRETLAYGKPVNPKETVIAIRAVTKGQIEEMAKHILQNDPAIAVLGEMNDPSLFEDAREAQRREIPLMGKYNTMALKLKGVMKSLRG